MAEATTSQTNGARVAAGTGAILSLGATLIATAPPAGAATVTVTSPLNDGTGSLREAIADAGPGDTITFADGLGPIQLTAEIPITKPLTIVDDEGDVTIDAGGTDRIFDIAGAGAVTISGITLTGGHSGLDEGGAIRVTGSDLTLVDSEITGNAAPLGGAIFAQDDSNVTIAGSTFRQNSAGDAGGAIDLRGGTLTVTDSTFDDNEASSAYDGEGGAISATSADAVTISASTFSANHARTSGGAVQVLFGEPTVSITDTTFTDNSTGFLGGAVNLGGLYDTEVTIARSTFEGNETTSSGAGGAIAVSEVTATVTISGSRFAANVAADGGAMALMDHDDGARVVVESSEFTGNEAEGDGGAIITEGEDNDITITTSTFSENHADSYGGAIIGVDHASLVVSQSTLTENTADDGGAIALGAGSASVVSSTISGNTAAHNGGGILFYGGTYVGQGETVEGDLVVAHSTIADNTANRGGGLFLAGTTGGTVTIDHTLIDGNVAVGAPDLAAVEEGSPGEAIFISDPDRSDVAAQALESVTLANSLVNGSIAGEVVDGGGNLFEVPANLGPLADNGGPTRTHTLLAGSAARNAGDPAFGGDPATDQRGLPRVSDGRIDIGAVEVQVQEPVDPAEPVTPPGTPAQPVPAQPDFTG